MFKNLLAATFVVLFSACAAHTVKPRVYNAAELIHGPLHQRVAFDGPTILKFERGDRLAVELSFNDELFELEPSAPPLALVARERCYVRIDGNGIRVSPDGRDFDRKPAAPGSFFVGFAAERGRALTFRVRVSTPRRR